MKKGYYFLPLEHMIPTVNEYNDKNSIRKMYYGQITGAGRDPEIYEFDGQFDIAEVDDALREVVLHETFGYTLVYPHILVDFYWGDKDTEGNLRKKSYKMKPHGSPDGKLTLEKISDIRKDDDSVIVGCLIELVDIHWFEAEAWASSETLEQYFGRRKKNLKPLTLRNPRKIEQYLQK